MSTSCISCHTSGTNSQRRQVLWPMLPSRSIPESGPGPDFPIPSLVFCSLNERNGLSWKGHWQTQRPRGTRIEWANIASWYSGREAGKVRAHLLSPVPIGHTHAQALFFSNYTSAWKGMDNTQGINCASAGPGFKRTVLTYRYPPEESSSKPIQQD